MLLLLPLPALAYGELDPGELSWEQRHLHVVTNYVRVDPEGWESEYSCRLSEFEASERTPKDPLLYHDGLAEIAQLHSEDMAAHGEMTHDSSDGTSFSERVWPYYPGTTIGENVAWGYSDTWTVMMQGWMCSAGHRSNIMAADFDDLGTGVVGAWYTQDFGGGAGSGHHPLAMGVHSPATPGGTVSFMTTLQDNSAVGVSVETEEACGEMELVAGSSTRGAFELDASAGSGCQRYRFMYELSGGTTGFLPDSGSYQYGGGCDPWVATTSDSCLPGGGPDDTGDPGGSDDSGTPDGGDDTGDSGEGGGDLSKGCACGSAGSPAPWLWLVLPGLLLGIRREGFSTNGDALH